MYGFREDVQRAVDYHGHLCSGQLVGVKMARAGLRALGLHNDDPADRKKIYVFVECDRCPADAIGIVTNTRVGKRTLRALDLGKIAATFVNLETHKAVRVVRAVRKHPGDGEDMIAFYENLSDEGFLTVTNVSVALDENDLPGEPRQIVTCAKCGESVTDGRHVTVGGQTLCRSCADKPYYTVL